MLLMDHVVDHENGPTERMEVVARVKGRTVGGLKGVVRHIQDVLRVRFHTARTQ